MAITSNNPDVTVLPTELTFSSANYRQWQTVKVSTLRDPNDTDESATLAHRGPSLSYGSILVSVNDTWPGAAVETVNGRTVTVRHTLDAPYGVTVTAPSTLDANTDITIAIAGPPPGTPEGAPGYGLGQSAAARMLADIRVSGTPADGLTICIPIPEALLTEAGDHPLTLLRYANGVWTPAAGTERLDMDGAPALLCAAGITEYGTFAAAYTLPALGAVSDLTATPGEAPGSITLTWTPGANAERPWIAGVKQSDRSQFAIWAAADNMGSHTVTYLEPGATYIFTITAGRGEGDSRQWSTWSPWSTITLPAPKPTPTSTPKPTLTRRPSPCRGSSGPSPCGGGCATAPSWGGLLNPPPTRVAEIRPPPRQPSGKQKVGDGPARTGECQWADAASPWKPPAVSPFVSARRFQSMLQTIGAS